MKKRVAVIAIALALCVAFCGCEALLTGLFDKIVGNSIPMQFTIKVCTEDNYSFEADVIADGQDPIHVRAFKRGDQFVFLYNIETAEGTLYFRELYMDLEMSSEETDKTFEHYLILHNTDPYEATGATSGVYMLIPEAEGEGADNGAANAVLTATIMQHMMGGVFSLLTKEVSDTIDGETFSKYSLTPEDGSTMTYWYDSAELRRFELKTGEKTYSVTYDNYEFTDPGADYFGDPTTNENFIATEIEIPSVFGDFVSEFNDASKSADADKAGDTDTSTGDNDTPPVDVEPEEV